MSYRRRFLSCAALLFSSVLLAGQTSSPNQEGNSRVEYTLASLSGNYAAVATYGGNIAMALGTQKLDGMGKLTGSAIVNQPGPNGARTVVEISFIGTYTVNSDGPALFR